MHLTKTISSPLLSKSYVQLTQMIDNKDEIIFTKEDGKVSVHYNAEDFVWCEQPYVSSWGRGHHHKSGSSFNTQVVQITSQHENEKELARLVQELKMILVARERPLFHRLLQFYGYFFVCNDNGIYGYVCSEPFELTGQEVYERFHANTNSFPENFLGGIACAVLNAVQYLINWASENRLETKCLIEPKSILFNQNGVIKLCDLQVRISETDGINYWPPNCFIDDEYVGTIESMSLWSLGITLIEMSYGSNIIKPKNHKFGSVFMELKEFFKNFSVEKAIEDYVSSPNIKEIVKACLDRDRNVSFALNNISLRYFDFCVPDYVQKLLIQNQVIRHFILMHESSILYLNIILLDPGS